MTYILAIDQRTSGTKAIVVDEAGMVLSLAEVGLYPRYFGGGGVERCLGVFRSPSEIVANANPLGGPIAIELSALVGQGRLGEGAGSS